MFSLQSTAQICINKYTGISFQTTTFEAFTSSTVAPNNEIISAGTLYDFNSAGHIAKYSAKGNPIWSYRYNLNFFDFVKSIFFKAINIAAIVSTADGGMIIAGNTEQVLSPFGLPPPVKKWGLMAKLDRFGKVLWTKTVTKDGEMNFTNLYLTADGDIIAYLATDNGPKRGPGDHSYNNVLRIGQDGEVKWSSFLFTLLFDAGGLGVANKRAIVQATNGNIVIGDVAHKTVANTGEIKEGNLHFFELNYATGKLNWERSYEYGALSSTYVPDIVNIKELANGKFSFITTLYLTGVNGFVKKGANIITSNRGAIENIIAYTPFDGSPCSIKEASTDKNTGNRVLLFDKSGKNMLVNIDDDGQVVWQQGYSDKQGAFPVNCFSAGKNGYNIFTSNNNSKQYGLLITDNTGVIDCANETPDITAVPATLNLTRDSMVTDFNYNFRDDYYDYAHPLKRGEAYPLIKNIDCQQTLACCRDFIDSSIANTYTICEGSSYMLPDSTVIKDSGIYYVNFKTVLGCDSIRFYKIKLDKDVSLLGIGNDTCLTGSSTITLKATEGYGKYYWMNSLLPGNAAYTVTLPGKYFATVNNVCGSKTDSVEIFDVCDYPLYMPNAFTPNGDKINDVFRIAPDNKNRLLSFRIYNRWGKIVFQTTNLSEGWDGTYKNEPLGTDTFIYMVEMVTLSGKRVTKKGYITLLR
ncbi:MAG: gliding motility-associated C-terminal domain-containing protein [Chitinophagaceae bacterium]|nr:gliding motility-associated C-terminal domain-containing protein [Chitinophagaceae bacterium]